MNIRAVLFDWRGVLVHDPEAAWWVRTAHARLGRSVDDQGVSRLVDRLDAEFRSDGFRAAELAIDCDAAVHRTVMLDLFARAGMDDPLADALYALDFDSDCHPLYPDVASTFRTLHDAGVAIAVVSDIHFDLRPEFAEHGISADVDAFVLSFEHGVQKPDRRMFEIALDQLGVDASDALIVGDRASHDGGAVAAGITTLLLPPLAVLGPRGLDIVLRIVGAPAR